ncbi:hypothetical protein [Natranaerofaba carboxydovora]|uniref:hypothetical protein n=1 Tax=Natranaerofaba carboxydovora TaxID=2742683 RepID=UPI001F13CB6B|nr:hypothetical protein [Natranaerofaba carboxydovora]UMZ75201.1 hypothetical protein ACONDI_02816 [Natranaerofaba carboxydovora]
MVNKLSCSKECKFKQKDDDNNSYCNLNSNLIYPVDIPECLNYQFEYEFGTYTS